MMFFVYADIGTTLALLSYGSLQMAFPGCALLASNGIYVQIYHSPRALIAHLTWCAATVSLIFFLILASSGTDHGLAIFQLLILVPVIFSTPVFLQSIQLHLLVDAVGAKIDPLTGLLNRRGLDADLVDFLDGATDISVMVIDVDRFKAINDSFGHSCGDAALQLLAQKLRIDNVLVARTGGEEFVIVTRVPMNQGKAVAEWIRWLLHVPCGSTSLTVSIGLAHTLLEQADAVTTVTALVRRADVAMYEAKRGGGNQVVAG